MYVKIGSYVSHLVDPIFRAWNNRPWNNRKVKVVIHPYDTWSMDSTLAFIILTMLKQLKDTKHGSPYVDYEDVPENLKSTSAPPFDKSNGDIDDNHHARWEYVLDQMIWSFEQVNSEWEDQFHHPDTGVKFDIEGYKAHYKKMENGMKLFGRYYFALWD